MKRITLTRKGFRKWLEGKPGGRFVGRGGEPHDCPFFHYLTALGIKNARVGAYTYGSEFSKFGSTQKTADLPGWALQTRRRIDIKFPFSPITARQALTVLEGKEQ